MRWSATMPPALCDMFGRPVPENVLVVFRRDVLAEVLWEYGEDALARGALDLSEQELREVQVLTVWHRHNAPEPNEGPRLTNGRLMARAMIEFAEGRARDTARKRRRTRSKNDAYDGAYHASLLANKPLPSTPAEREYALPMLKISMAATSLTSGAFSPTRTVSAEDVLEHFEGRVARGAGYLEISRADRLYPGLFVGLQGRSAVLHVAWEDSLDLMLGDGSLSAEDETEVLIIDHPSVFTGDFVMTIDHARTVLEGFLRTGSVGDHPTWRMT